MGNINGMNWIRQEKRLAIYLRDGLACVWCGRAVEGEVVLTLDHAIPRNAGGSNAAENLVTACSHCNSVRKDRPMKGFAYSVAEYLDADPKEILNRVRACRSRKLPMKQAKELIALRGSASKAIQEM